jgi:hypothetical protein
MIMELAAASSGVLSAAALVSPTIIGVDALKAGKTSWLHDEVLAFHWPALGPT